MGVGSEAPQDGHVRYWAEESSDAELPEHLRDSRDRRAVTVTST